MEADVLEYARRALEAGERVALVTVTGTEGSSPASAGQMMAVRADGTTAGTVGGGATEHRARQDALRAMRDGARVFRFDYDHAENGMVCGGGMHGFGNILGNDARLVVFGGGHVAQSLARLAAAVGFSVTVIEDRPEFADAFPGAKYMLCAPDRYAQEVALSQADYAVICTRGHQSDEAALRFCLTRTPRYCGMIGSEKKVVALFARLREAGVEPERLEAVYAPIGLDVADEVPAEIAVSILAEILLVKNGGKARHRRDRRGK